MVNQALDVILPEWPAPSNVYACCTTRIGRQPARALSETPAQTGYASFNLAEHVGDDPEAVQRNRRELVRALGLPGQPFWLNQVHSHVAVEYRKDPELPDADASFTRQANQVCAVLTADCLPLLICHKQGKAVAAVHAGWRGLLNGVIEATLEQLAYPGDELLVWLGPAIGPEHFIVGPEVRHAFVQQDSAADACFTTIKDKFLTNIYQLANLRLTKYGVASIYGGQFCSYRDAERFYSYRREHTTGRMASLIYFHE